MRTIIHKVAKVLLLGLGLIITGQAILTPLLMVLMMVTGDILAMSSSTDNVVPSAKPSVWNIGHLTWAALGMGLFELAFCAASIATGRYLLHLDTISLRTLTVVTLDFSAQAVLYVARERRHFWRSRPGRLLMASSVVDLSIVLLLSGFGMLMKPLAPTILASLFAAAILFIFVLDAVKIALFQRLSIN